VLQCRFGGAWVNKYWKMFMNGIQRAVKFYWWHINITSSQNFRKSIIFIWKHNGNFVSPYRPSIQDLLKLKMEMWHLLPLLLFTKTIGNPLTSFSVLLNNLLACLWISFAAPPFKLSNCRYTLLLFIRMPHCYRASTFSTFLGFES